MNSVKFSLTTNETESNFPSLTAMRIAHSELLKKSLDAEDNKTTVQLMPEIKTFLRRGQATGVILDAESERNTAQNLLNYWRAILYRWGDKPSLVTLASS